MNSAIYVINTTNLFNLLNAKRKAARHTEVEHHLIANKLGVLFALNSNSYVNFKGEFVELNHEQLQTLETIFGEHFNTPMAEEIRKLTMSQQEHTEELLAHLPQSLTTAKTGFFSKIKGLIATKALF